MSEALEADPGAPRRPEGEGRGTGRLDWTPAFANPQGSERLAEYLDTFHRLTGIRSRLVIEADSGELTVHDSLGDPGRAEFTEMTWLVMPSVRIRNNFV